MIVYEYGDLLESDCDMKCHQVNCKGKMGAGIALKIRNKYPYVYDRYRDLCNTDRNLLGEVQFLYVDDCIVVNMFAQYGYGRYGVHTDYNAFEKCVSAIKLYAEKYNYSVGFPYKIGCGLAGGDWETVLKIIKKYFENSKVLCKIIEYKEV